MSLNRIVLRFDASCLHCDQPMVLMHDTDAEDLRYICKGGCKAEYGVVLNVGTCTELPICGSKRVSTRSH